MANIIKIKNGLSTNLSKANLQKGELAFTTDTHQLYTSDGAGNTVHLTKTDYNAQPGESGYIENRTHYIDKNGNCVQLDDKYLKPIESGEILIADGFDIWDQTSYDSGVFYRNIQAGKTYRAYTDNYFLGEAVAAENGKVVIYEEYNCYFTFTEADSRCQASKNADGTSGGGPSMSFDYTNVQLKEKVGKIKDSYLELKTVNGEKIQGGGNISVPVIYYGTSAPSDDIGKDGDLFVIVKPATITFYIGSDSFTADYGMTWLQWMNSGYNTIGAFTEANSDGDRVVYIDGSNGRYICETRSPQDKFAYATDIIISGHTYDKSYKYPLGPGGSN